MMRRRALVRSGGLLAVVGALLVVGCAPGRSDSSAVGEETSLATSHDPAVSPDVDDCVNGQFAQQVVSVDDGRRSLRSVSVAVSDDEVERASVHDIGVQDVGVSPTVILLVLNEAGNGTFFPEGDAPGISVGQQHLDSSGNVTCTDLAIESFHLVDDSLMLSGEDESQIEVWALELAANEHTQEASTKMLTGPGVFDDVLVWNPEERVFPDVGADSRDSSPFVAQERWLRLSEAYWGTT